MPLTGRNCKPSARVQGLSSRQKAVCDKFVYIPQYGSGTASLNVAVACSIVLHHFAVWAQYEEQTRQGEKYVVVEREHTVRGCARGAPLSCMVSCMECHTLRAVCNTAVLVL